MTPAGTRGSSSGLTVSATSGIPADFLTSGNVILPRRMPLTPREGRSVGERSKG
jgi:hypothetical protein